MLDPMSFDTGLDSPVSIASLHIPFPMMTTPSTGTP